MQKLFIYICLILLSTRCAQIAPLTGGKIDTSPPKSISFNPPNASLNFNAKSIEINFNEYIVLKDIANQFIITPQTKETPDIEASGKKLKIKFNESLLPNTTYKLAFGNAISDLNESNNLQNFEYVFSTGSTIDSLKLSGQIINAFDKKPESDVLIGLYDINSNDSIIYKQKPVYITKANSNGNFNFNYLPNSLFKIVAIKDQNKNLLYDGSEEQISFMKDPVNTNDSSKISMLLFKEMPTKNFIKKSFSPEYGKAIIVYNKPQMDINNVNAKGIIHFQQNKLKDTLILYYTNKFDTLQVFVNHKSKSIDTIQVKIPSERAIDKQYKSNLIKFNLLSNITPSFPFYQLPTFELNFITESKNIFLDKIILLEKTDSITKPLPLSLIMDKGWNTHFVIQAEFKTESSYTLTIYKGAITDDSKRINDSVAYQFKTNVIDDYAQLNMKLFFPKKENYIVMLLNDKEQIINERVIEFSLTSTSEKNLEYKYLTPGNYYMKVIEDANKNGVFDTGDYFLNKQPEIIYINSTPVKLLAGWEIENEWIIK